MTAADVIRMLLEMDQQVISPRPSTLGRAAKLVATLCDLAELYSPAGVRWDEVTGDWKTIDLSPIVSRAPRNLDQPTMSLAEENERLRRELDEVKKVLHRIAFEPFGHAEASHAEVLDAIEGLARETVAKLTE